MDILNDTLALLQQTTKSRKQIANETGLGFDWLNKLAQGHITDPGIKRITKLHDYLADKAA